MEYIFTSLMNILITAVTELASYLGGGVLSLLTLNIGKNGSFFNTIFTEVSDIGAIFRIMALMILIFNFIWQTIKIMTSPQASETPASLVVGTIVAGIGIYFAPTIISIFESIFNEFYKFILGYRGGIGIDGIELTGYKGSLGSLLLSFVTPFSLNHQASTVATLLCELIFLLLLSYRLLMFLIEVVERYIILGILYYTAPLAFSIAGSKSTRNIFSSWVRMVASQLILMVFNVVFFKLFLMGATGLGNLLHRVAANGDTAIGYCIAGNLMLYGILYAATRVDSYMNSLGLNVAQAGSGMASTILMSVGSMGRTAMSIGKQVSSSVRNNQSTAPRAYDKKADPSTGAATKTTTLHAMNGQLKQSIDGYAGGASIHSMLKGSVSQKVLDRAELPSCRIDPKTGVASMDFDSGPGKEKTKFYMASESSLAAAGYNPATMQGLRVSAFNEDTGKTETLIGWAEGPIAKDLMTQNPALEEKMREFGSLPNQRVIPPSPEAPGVWTAIKEDPETGAIVEATQYSPATYYPPESNSHPEQFGEQAVHVMDTTAFHANAQHQSEAMEKFQETATLVQSAQEQMQMAVSQAEPVPATATGETTVVPTVENHVSPAAPIFEASVPIGGASEPFNHEYTVTGDHVPARSNTVVQQQSATPIADAAAEVSAHQSAAPTHAPIVRNSTAYEVSTPAPNTAPVMSTEELQQHYVAMQSYSEQATHYNPTRIGGFIPNPTIDPDRGSGEAAKAFHQHFPSFQSVEVAQINPSVGNGTFASQGPDAGIISFQISSTGEQFYLAPAAEYQVRSLSQTMSPDIRTVTAANGTTYVQVPQNPNVAISDVFLKRPNTTSQVITSAPAPTPDRTRLQPSPQAPANRSSNTVAKSAYNIRGKRTRNR